METVKRMVLSNGHCLTPACVLSLRSWWLMWTGLLHECPMNWQHRQKNDLRQIPALKFVQRWAHSLSKPEQAKWFLRTTRFSGKPSHSSISNQESSWHRVWAVCQTLSFSLFNIAKETLFIDLTLCENGNCEDNGSLTIVTCWPLHVWWSMWTGLLHECLINWQHSQDIELGQVFVFPAWPKLFNAGLMLAWTGKGNMISGSW